MWFKKTPIYDGREYALKGEVSQYVARLIFADFPTSMLVDGIHNHTIGELFLCHLGGFVLVIEFIYVMM
ncbi:hypothetical protein GOP47_0025723 [Adiantum capillus-veneris]|uniref:Uncharacterized protein n=1 Tax=Adiantum capillus-veneris TaxID=13818 RepID=A0A9D4U0U5_ADICA|nr:hypothetical protein GOP47_0025723 [Adiantum capillus-veneris]